MNYPTKKPVITNNDESNNKRSKIKTFSNRGMNLEKDINTTNTYYLETDKAIIHKKPTPVRIVKVDYPARKAAKITEAYYTEASTTDYNGIYKGKYIDFEAKESMSKTAFPFSSIHPHQIKHLQACLNHGAIAFVILRMVILDSTYLIKADEFIDFYNNTDRKSLPISWILEHGHIIEYSYVKPCDYLKTVDKVYNLD